MCGKFTQLSSWEDVHAFSQPLVAKEPLLSQIVVSTPMRMAKIIRLSAEGKRELVEMRWGFAGRGDANPGRPKHMHARAESIDRLPTFAHHFANHRGILMVHTFNEGEELPNGKTKQWTIAPNDGQVIAIAIAVIYEEWRNGFETLETFVQVTVPANELISRITDRMPAILPREAWSTWIGETNASTDEVKTLLQTFADGGNWTMTEEKPSKPPRRAKPTKAQQELF